MNDIDCKLTTLLDKYAYVEKEIQKNIYQTCCFCGTCSLKCCKEELCKESIESSFLSILIEHQKIRYDTENGWISPSGCRLGYGRPLVCYEFFCKDILNSSLFKAANIQKIIGDFVSVGNKAHGNTHLQCINNLETISSAKMEKMISKINLVMDNIRLHGHTQKNRRV